MLFLDFLCLFFCIVLLNAHPISKRNSHNISELVKKLDNGHIITSYPTYNLLNHLYPTWKGQIFQEQDENTDEINKLDLTKIPKKHIKFKRITTKVMDLREFERLENFGNRKYLHNSIKTYKVKDQENHAANNRKQITNSNLNPVSRFLDNKYVFYNDISMDPTRDDTEFAGTAEIEAILNEIKQREIQMIADQIPTVSNLIANTVTETTFASMPLISDSSIYPGFVFSTFLLMDNNSLVNFVNNPQSGHLPYLKLHNIALRSLKDDSSTLAQDVENILQKKIKKVYHKIKNKISKDFNKEIKKTKATVKEQIDKINKKTTSVNVGSRKSSLQKGTTKPIPKTQKTFTLNEARNSRNTLCNIKKHKLTTLTTHTIPTIGDDLSMLSIVEQLLEKSEEDNAMNLLTTKNNYLAKKDNEKLFKRNSVHETLKQSNRKLLNNEEDVLDTEYTHSDNRIINDTENTNINTDATTEDTSYEGLSNKLSYSDYVNGFKYYLKFQKDREDEKYSNQVRYQAHKHHSVDDIGKFILNKIPQLPTHRQRRDPINSKPLDVQGVTTKSEDSWFKKHFFIFMDSNTPKKFHTAQTVSLKPSAIQVKSIFLDNETTKQTHNSKELSYLVPRRLKKNIFEAKNSVNEPKYNFKTGLKRRRAYRELRKRSKLENHYKQKSDSITSINYRKNGFVDIDLINKPTAIIKLNNKNKKTNKIRHIFKKIRFGHNKHKKKEKRQSQNRFNIFKGIRNIFKEKCDGYKELKNTKQHKIFDYEVMTTNSYAQKIQSYEVPKFKKLSNIDVLRQQIPNISADFSTPYTVFSGSYINLTDLASVSSGPRNEKFIYNKKPQLDDERKSFSILTGSEYLKDNQHSAPYFFANNQTENNQKNLKIDDIINVSIESNNHDVVFPEKSNSLGYPVVMGMTKSVIRNEVDDLSMRLNTKEKTFSTNDKNQFLPLLRFNTYPKSKLSKEYQIENILMNNAGKKNKINFKKPATMPIITSRKYLSKKSPRKNKLTFFINSSRSLAQISSQSPFKDKKLQMDTKSNRHDIDVKTFDFQPKLLVDPTIYGYQKSLSNFSIPDKNMVFKKNKLKANSFEDPKMFAYEKTLNSLTTPERELAASYNNNLEIAKNRPFTKVNTPPEQYYSTPLPMQMDDFYKFLKSQNIDVDFVTAPLLDSVPKRINTWNLYKKNVSKLSSKQDKMIPKKQQLKTNNKKLSAGGQSNKNHALAKGNKQQTKILQTKKLQTKKLQTKKLQTKKLQTKKVLAKPRLEKQKDHAIGNDRKTTPVSGETPEYENSNCFLRNEKHKRNLRTNSNLMSRLNLGSMDLFQFDNSPKQPVVNSKKEAEDMDVTVIDLESKKIDSNAYKELAITNFNKINKYQQPRTKTNLSNNDLSLTTFIEPLRDPLRFTHMYNEHTTPKQSMNSPLDSYLHKKTTLSPTQPQRVQISGHSYKYDIIYQKPNYDWLNDLYEVNPTLITNNIVNYRNYTTTIKKEKGSDQWYRYQRGNYPVYYDNDLITFASNKKKKETYNLVKSVPDYMTEIKNIELPKKKNDAPKIKIKENFFFDITKVNNIDDEVYFEPFVRHKSNKSKSQGRVSTNNNKYYKRDVQGQDSFTAKDVAALEVVVDLMKSTESFEDKGFRNAFLDIDNQKNIPYIITSLKPQNHATNAIQVHIALPSNINDKKRSLEPIKVRKIFSAIMSSPVDLEYQIHSFEDDKVTKITQDVISPGLYLLVENTNITIPKGNFALKPIRRNLILPKRSDLILHYKNNMTDSINDHISTVPINPDFIAAVDNQPVKLYANMATLNEIKSKRYVKEEEEKNKLKIKRNSNWESVKHYFGHDRVCQCKVNKTMCKPCAASDAIITELVFEFDNLAKYMADHCSEIETFFWMNPTGGRKLKDTVHRLDTTLNNYNKRVKGKCQSRTCKRISSNIDKREYKKRSSINQFLNDFESIANYLQKVLQYNVTCDADVHNAAKKCINAINNCVSKNLNKRSYTLNLEELNNKSVYSLNNIRVNLICNKDLTKHATYFTRNTITEVLLENNTNTPLYFDEDEVKKDKKIGKGIKELLKKYSNKIKFKNIETPQIIDKNNNMFTKKHFKRNSVSYNQIEAPYLADSGGTFWYKYLHDNMREPRQQKDNSKQIYTKRTINKQSKFANWKLTTKYITNNTRIVNTSKNIKSNINLQKEANETDDTSLNIDTLNHNLNDLFKLLGNTDTVQGNRSKLSKLTTLSKKQPSTNIHNSIKARSKLTTTTKIKATKKLTIKTTVKKDHLKLDTTKSQQNIKKVGRNETKATQTILTKKHKPTILQPIQTTITNSKVGFLNKIVSGSLKFFSNSDIRKTTHTETQTSNKEHQPRMKYRQKLGANTEKYALRDNYQYEIDNNENSTTSTEPTIIIISDIGSSVQYTVSINKKDLIEHHSPDTVKRNSFKLVKEKNNVESPEVEMNDIGYDALYNRVKLKKHKVPQLKNCEYYDYDIIHSLRKCLGLTSSNLTTPSQKKGAINNFFDKFAIQIISDSERIEPGKMKASHGKKSSKNIPKLGVVTKSVEKTISDSSVASSSTKTSAAISNITKNTSNKDAIKLATHKNNQTKSRSGIRDHMTKHLREAGEEKLNQICDVTSTMEYVSKLQKSMSKNNFERYVKNIPCHKYNKTPQHFIIRSCKRKRSKAYYKLNGKSKIFEFNKHKIHKWAWIRDKRSIIKDKTTVQDDKGNHFNELKKNSLSGCSTPFIVTNCVNVDKDNENQEVNCHREVKREINGTRDYSTKTKNINDNYVSKNKINIVHNKEFQKRNLFSNYLLKRRGYKKISHLNENFIRLWYGENDYYENFVRGNNGIYRKSLKRRKRLDVDMSELNDGLLNLSPLDPFTDEIYAMVGNSISFDCHFFGPIKNRHEDYIWTSDRLGILDFDNVMIEGPKVFINTIKTNNFGNYMCSVENAIVRSIKITVIDVPNIDIVFTPIYKTATCNYDDLKSVLKLNVPMSYFTHKFNSSVRIDEPICLKDSVDGSALVRPIVVMSVKRQSNINCSAECLRDLHCSFALLFAKNAPFLAFVKVLISYNGTKTILSPLRERRKSFVTHTLRRKDTNGHREYHRLAADMDPNSVNVVLLCSAGFYLVVGQKICAVCPPNTFSLEGENVCRNCPRGAHSEPGARSCRLSLHLRRNKWPWKYVCGGAVCMLSCVIASCYAVSRLLRQPVPTEVTKTCRKTRKTPRKESHQKKTKNRPLSPSRVILSRLLRGSLSSSRATDSQETRFELWKEKNTLPPLPPIDFEL